MVLYKSFINDGLLTKPLEVKRDKISINKSAFKIIF